jgi:hypothetical protein
MILSLKSIKPRDLNVPVADENKNDRVDQRCPVKNQQQ